MLTFFYPLFFFFLVLSRFRVSSRWHAFGCLGRSLCRINPALRTDLTSACRFHIDLRVFFFFDKERRERQSEAFA